MPGGLPTVVLDRWVAGGEVIDNEEEVESDNINMTDELNCGVCMYMNE